MVYLDLKKIKKSLCKKDSFFLSLQKFLLKLRLSNPSASIIHTTSTKNMSTNVLIFFNRLFLAKSKCYFSREKSGSRF